MSKMEEAMNKTRDIMSEDVGSEWYKGFFAGWQAHAVSQWVTITDNPETWPPIGIILAVYETGLMLVERVFIFERPACMFRWMPIPEYKEPR